MSTNSICFHFLYKSICCWHIFEFIYKSICCYKTYVVFIKAYIFLRDKHVFFFFFYIKIYVVGTQFK